MNPAKPANDPHQTEENQAEENHQIPFWYDSEDRDRGLPPDYHLSPAELDAQDS